MIALSRPLAITMVMKACLCQIRGHKLILGTLQWHRLKCRLGLALDRLNGSVLLIVKSVCAHSPSFSGRIVAIAKISS